MASDETDGCDNANVAPGRLWQERLHDLGLVRRAAIESRIVEIPGVAGNRVLIKYEPDQKIRSFKIRGATYAMASDLDNLRERGVVADSGGNHSQAVALAGRELGVPVHIIMAAVVPENKVAATRSFGATDGSFELDTSPSSFVAAKAKAKRVAAEQGKRYLSPYDDACIVRGTATLVPEIMQQLAASNRESPYAVHVPVGGGGLISGIADVNREQGHLFELYGYGITDADSAARSLRAVRERGATEPVPVPGEVNRDAEGLAVKCIGNEAFRRIRDGKIDDIYTIESLAEVGAAYMWYMQNAMPALGVDTSNDAAVWDAMPEVSSMVAVAGVLKHLRESGTQNQTHLVIISGSNTDRESFQHAIDAA
jgi:threonine dehydratase